MRASPSTLTAAELQRQRLLAGPIISTLLMLAWPTMLQMLTYAAVLLYETWLIGKLGVVSLAGASLVTPAMFLMQAMAVGGLGSAVTATIARATGSGNSDKLPSLAVHALVIAVVCGSAFTVAMLTGGAGFYRMLGAKDGALDAALAYSNTLFLAAPFLWLVTILGAVLRGVGVVKVQAVINISASMLLLPLSPLLIFGYGPIPALGMPGAALAVMSYYLVMAALYLTYLSNSRSAVRIRLNDIVLSGADFAAILRLGGISSLLAVQSHITALIITGLAGTFGTVVLAGFGAAMRLQQVVEPFVFSLGTATVVMVATCFGAGKVERARNVAFTSALAGTLFCGSIGVLAALYPAAWVGLFSQDPQVIAAGAVYLQIIGPVYWCLGLGLVLYYCSQGIGRMLWTYAGSVARLLIVAVAGTFSLSVLGGDSASLYWVVATAMVVSCAITALGIARSDWTRPVSAAKARAPT